MKLFQGIEVPGGFQGEKCDCFKMYVHEGMRSFPEGPCAFYVQ